MTNPLHCSFVIQALDTDGSALEKARNAISSKRHLRRDIGITSPRIIERQGVWIVVRKPWTPDIDEWTHYLHGPDSNPVANDKVVGPPKHYQWIAGPLWFRSHDTDSSVTAIVTVLGRIFYLVDEAPISLTGDHPLPDRWFLVAQDAFNGVLLWQVPIERWGWREWKESHALTPARAR